MRIAWFSPLPPMPSGIADYSEEILPYVAQRATVDVFCPRPGLFRKPRAPKGVVVKEPPEYFLSPAEYDACFYHLGNNPYHEYVYLAARRRPEIAVFHDAVLHHLIAHVTIEQGGDPGRYEGILHGEHGERGTRLAMLRRSGLATDFEKFLFPLTAHVAQHARGIIVHSQDAADRMREAAPDVPLTVIPHHAGLPPPEVEGLNRAAARERLGLPKDAFIVGHFGFITKPKQPAAVVGGFAAMHREFPDSLLLMVGADHTGGALGRLVDQLGIEKAVRMAGYVDLVKFYVYLRAVDVVINLRYPTAGETSGTLARSLAEGRAVIVNNYASWAELPNDVALKVEIDGPQAEQVGDHLRRLAGDAMYRAGIEERCRRYAAEFLDPVQCRDLYLSFAEEVGSEESMAVVNAPSGRTGRPLTFAETLALHNRLRPRIDDVAGATLSNSGVGPYVDLLYRLLLRRPAEEEALRHGHAELSFGAKLTRAKLARDIVESREFQEILLVEDVLKERMGSPEPFTLEPDAGYAPGTTERSIEIPWMLTRYRGEHRVLDLGYAFASGVYLSALLDLGVPELHGVDLATAPVPGMDRVRADLRVLPYRDGAFDLVVCISTLDHVGRDNTRYGLPFEHPDPSGPERALAEIVRVLKADGRALVSVPYGRREDHGWLLQFDHESWNELVRRTPFEVQEQETFRHAEAGWEKVGDPRSLGLLSYGDGVPAARGVLCAVLVKPA